MTLNPIPILSICVATRNRPNDIVRCINSFELLKQVEFEVIVLDDASEIPVATYLFEKVDPDLTSKISLFRNEQNQGCPAARNQMVKLAKASYVLGIDDDAELFDAASIEAAIQVLETDSRIGAIAFSQMTSERTLFPGQPSPQSYNCYNPWYIGYGHVLRRDIFVELGGYREIFVAYYEEAELCARMLDRGYYVVYLPDSIIVHHHSSVGRDPLKCLSNSYRNKCYAALYNQPLLLMLCTIPLHVLLYFWTHQTLCYKRKKRLEKGPQWLVRELMTAARSIYLERKALRWSTYYKLYKIKQNRPKYEGVA
ncbi:family 2 glycosyl transferase [Leptolyngbya sp. NIES-3755]|nr:family 2 glycosyl transferase [Leptolyngbya sp. NIES-3755]